MPTYETPGVYYERVDANAATISPLRTDIAGFIGIARRGPVNVPVPIESWRQFQAYFGSFTSAGYLAYAVRGFFENNGRRCRVVRVASERAATAHAIFHSPPPADNEIWRIAAFSPGVWGNDIEITLQETHRAQTVAQPGYSMPEYTEVESTSGFSRATHARITQEARDPVWKVVSEVDPVRNRLIWVHPKREKRFPYDSPLDGIDPNLPLVIESVEYTLLVWELGRLVALYEGLSLVPAPESQRDGTRVLAGVKIQTAASPLRTIPATPHLVVIEERRDTNHLTEISPLHLADPTNGDPVTRRTMALTGGVDGLSNLTVLDFIGEEVYPLDSYPEKERKQRGLRALEDVDEVAILAVPDIHIQPRPVPRKSPPPPCEPDECLPFPLVLPAKPRQPAVGELPPIFFESQIYQVQAAMIEQCEKRKDRIALLDPPFLTAQNNQLGVGAVRAWRSRFDSKYAAFYYPWARVVDPLRLPGSLTRDIPPSGHVAGQYAQAEFDVGVHKAPANTPLNWVQDVTVTMNDAVHGLLNPLGINVIRIQPGRGIRILGARTISSDPDWRFVNVRRLLITIEKAIAIALQWAAFEPNNVFTRTKVQLTLTSFLLAFWQRGALVGDSPQQAFFVKCDEENNPPNETANGRLLAQIGVAPSKPYEFVILRVGRVNNEFDIAEGSAFTVVGGGI